MKFDKLLDMLIDQVPDDWYDNPKHGTVILIYYAVDNNNIPRYVAGIYYRQFKNVKTVVYNFSTGKPPRLWAIKNDTLTVHKSFQLVQVARVHFENGYPEVWYVSENPKEEVVL